MSELPALIDALTAAREAHAAATVALRRAEDAARATGLSVEPTVIDELTVKRIHVVDDDGMLRMIIGNSTMGRTMPMRGRSSTTRVGRRSRAFSS